MTVATVDAVVGHVMRVAELQGLLDEFLGTRDIRAAAKDYEQADQTAGQEKRADNTGFREGIGAGLKNLRHLIVDDRRRPRGARAPHQERQERRFPTRICTTL